MASRRFRAVGSFVVAVTVAQILFEDVLMFFAITGTGSLDVSNSPYILVGVPLVLSGSLLLVLVGWAVLYDETLR